MTTLIRNDISNNKSIDLTGYYNPQQHQQHMQQNQFKHKTKQKFI